MADPVTEKLLKLPRDELLAELRKMHPHERLIRIKKLEEARKKDLEETEKLKQQSLEEVSLEEVLERPDEQKIPAFDLESMFPSGVKVEEDIVDQPFSADYGMAVADIYNKVNDVIQQSYFQSPADMYHRDDDDVDIRDIANASRKMMRSFLASYQKFNDYII